MTFEVFISAMAVLNVFALVLAGLSLNDIRKDISGVRMLEEKRYAGTAERLSRMEGKIDKVLEAGDEENGGSRAMDEGISNILQFSAGGERR